MPERGFVVPGDIIVELIATCSYGALCAFATAWAQQIAIGVVTCHMVAHGSWCRARSMRTGELPWYVCEGYHLRDCTPGVDGAEYRAIEYTGEVVERLDERAHHLIHNMAIEMGGSKGLISLDAITQSGCADVSNVTIPCSRLKNPVYERTFDIDALIPESHDSPARCVGVNVAPVEQVEKCANRSGL